ncbi:MAG: DNA polymerase IV [Candidatus Baldrarchaeia archaeon]
MNVKRRIIFHVDMDAFYASVEESLNPDYRGKPLIVGADPKGGKGRGVVLTANYEARKFGIHSGMPISKAYKLCPDGIYVRPRFDKYHEFSQRTIEIIRKYSRKIQRVSIDEAYVDVTNVVGDFQEAEKLARKMQSEIWKKLGITCSIGIGPNKLVAKMASSMNKPNKVTVVEPDKVREFLHPLPVEKMYGIGPKTAERLRELGIETVGDLANFDAVKLAEVFGKNMAYYFIMLANGQDYSEVKEEARKSIGREITFEEDADSIEEILKELSSIVDDLIRKVKEEQLTFRTITVKLRYSNFETHTKSKTFNSIALDPKKVLKKVEELFFTIYNGGQKLRLIGVRFSNLIDLSSQRTLLEFI